MILYTLSRVAWDSPNPDSLKVLGVASLVIGARMTASEGGITARNHTAETIMLTTEVCFAYFLPTDSRHWIPNGTDTVSIATPEEWMDCDQSEWEDLLTESAENWCEIMHGKGSFWGMIWED